MRKEYKMEFDNYGRPIMSHIPYENGGGTGGTKMMPVKKIEWVYSWVRHCCIKKEKTLMVPVIERPEDPIDEVIQITEGAWEKNDLCISGDKLDNGNDNDLK